MHISRMQVAGDVECFCGDNCLNAGESRLLRCTYGPKSYDRACCCWIPSGYVCSVQVGTGLILQLFVFNVHGLPFARWGTNNVLGITRYRRFGYSFMPPLTSDPGPSQRWVAYLFLLVARGRARRSRA